MLYLTRSLGFDNAGADTQLGLWNGVCYLCPLLGGYVADATLGRWRAIVAFTALYAAGTAFLTAGVLVPRGEAGPGASLAFFAPVYVVAIGSGCLKPLVSTFGADQLEPPRPAGSPAAAASASVATAKASAIETF